MPLAANKICSQPCCGNVITDNATRCLLHKHQRQARHRIYDTRRWKKYRLQYLSLHPVCEKCDEKEHPLIIIATEVHHIIAVVDGGALMNEDNLMALCNSCHSKITAKNDFKAM